LSKRWTKEEIEFMKENYTKISKKEIAEILNRSITSIKSKARTKNGNFCDKNYGKPNLERYSNCIK
jgi:galactose-1-phosphate uridylyltransferase